MTEKEPLPETTTVADETIPLEKVKAAIAGAKDESAKEVLLGFEEKAKELSKLRTRPVLIM